MVHRAGAARWCGPRLVPVSRIYLIRHGRASGRWDDDPDPGLDEVGRDQAAATAQQLSSLERVALFSSPLRRCRETAQFLSDLWDGANVTIEPRVREIPSPDGLPLGRRVPWLRQAMEGTWSDLDRTYQEFRRQVVTCVSEQPTDAIVFSHFIAINAVIGACLGDDRVVIDSVDNASVTVVETTATGSLRLVERGRQANTLIR